MIAGDRILVCSDGLSGQLNNQYIANVLRTESNPQSAAHKLVEAAFDARSRDDVTALVIDAVTVDVLRSSGVAPHVRGNA